MKKGMAKCKERLLKAEKSYAKLVPVFTAALTVISLLSVIPTVEPIWHRTTADPLLMHKTKAPVDLLDRCLASLKARKAKAEAAAYSI